MVSQQSSDDHYGAPSTVVGWRGMAAWRGEGWGESAIGNVLKRFSNSLSHLIPFGK